MTSAIDPTKPEDGVSAEKAELRANLQAVKLEIEHGGFLAGLTPSNYAAADSRGRSHALGIDAALGGKADRITTVGMQSGDYTLALGDADKWVRIAATTAASVMVPAAADVAFAIGTRIYLRQAGSGQVSLTAAAGVTINTPETLTLRKQHATAALIKVATDEWDLMGDLEAGL